MSDCPYGAPVRTALARYVCDGPCGCWLPTPGECFVCWAARKTYTEREIRALPDDDPRRARVRPDRPRAGT